MKNIFQRKVILGKDLEKGDVFYTYKYNQEHQWTVQEEAKESILGIGVATKRGDRYLFRTNEVYIIESIKENGQEKD